MANRKAWAKTKKIGNCEFEIGDKQNDEVFYLGKNKNEIVDLLIAFTKKECENAWKYQPKSQTDMKRHFLTELSKKLKSYA